MKHEYKPTKILATLKNAEYGIEAVVAEISTGFSVVIRDTDAGEFLDIATIFDTEAKAMTNAAKLVA